jgi:iron uptake system EfeUOB component EfeO/EfeM
MKVKIKFENFESEVELSEKEVQMLIPLWEKQDKKIMSFLTREFKGIIREALKFGYERDGRKGN